MYSNGSNAFSKLRFGVVESALRGDANFGCAGLLVEWFRDETFWAKGRNAWVDRSGVRELLTADKHRVQVYEGLMLIDWPPTAEG